MIERRKRHIVPLINTTSTADISFILLVFFLLMTSMDVDKGLLRQLPNGDDSETHNIEDIKKENILSIKITSSGGILLDEKKIEINDVCPEAMDFILKSSNPKELIIAIEADPNASYESFFNVQNELILSYNTIRDGYAKRTLGKPYTLCSQIEREKIRELYPQRIAEVETIEEN